MPFDNLLIERDGAVAVVTVNRPKVLNALNAATIAELGRAFAELKADDAVLAVVLTGAGEKSFVAGADISELAAELAGKAPRSVEYILEAVNRGLDLPLEAGLDIEAALFGVASSTADMREGTTAFLEKRKAQFTGR